MNRDHSSSPQRSVGVACTIQMGGLCGGGFTTHPHGPVHYPYLLSTTCVSAGMIAMDAVVGDWPGDSAPLQPCRHVLDGLPYPLVMHVSHGLACGSIAAAPAVLAIRWRLQRLPRSSAPSGITCQGRYRCRPPLPVARRLACGSHAAAPAVLAIRRVAYRSPSWARDC